MTRGRAELRPTTLPPVGPEDAVVTTLWSGLSRGTERLVFEGRVSATESERMRAPLQEGDFPYPVKYGYCAVGLVEQGPPALRGRAVFALHPHQDRFVAPARLLAPVPEGVPPRRAVLAANMETALNALWDSGAGPGDRIVVVGAGVVGLLVGYLAARLPGADVTMVDIDLSREAIAKRVRLPLPQAARRVRRRGRGVPYERDGAGPCLRPVLRRRRGDGRRDELVWRRPGQRPSRPRLP